MISDSAVSFFLQELQGCMYDQTVEYHKHTRQDKNDYTCADQCSASQQQTNGADHINLGLDGDAKRSREE